ncbi:hypothetical protein SPRG_17883 [Saprolegnia parasitica CBS 223.65]|uniref:Uncharacterized protein n=1 Tax=Saprolegnia parasitica (strain CBS 223.65) TaxID=695850 RepID=A0A067BQM3_SAPPC|nr:hypothetical protein SPRG_17883 [Saprolegnia parasitica CBS 223.65]KDO16611.1 hypothetical protein SPRG_17883 [Saprolegnia parasitica CBS 223.65]|eukprot:XP_012212683.1 hypothetical protein SPRG_17883 [Saprolegnia parasitica CBS 223.65]
MYLLAALIMAAATQLAADSANCAWDTSAAQIQATCNAVTPDTIVLPQQTTVALDLTLLNATAYDPIEASVLALGSNDSDVLGSVRVLLPAATNATPQHLEFSLSTPPTHVRLTLSSASSTLCSTTWACSDVGNTTNSTTSNATIPAMTRADEKLSALSSVLVGGLVVSVAAAIGAGVFAWHLYRKGRPSLPAVPERFRWCTLVRAPSLRGEFATTDDWVDNWATSQSTISSHEDAPGSGYETLQLSPSSSSKMLSSRASTTDDVGSYRTSSLIAL